MMQNPYEKPVVMDVRIETFFPGDETPSSMKTERRPVRTAGARVEIWSVGQWIEGKYDGDVPVLTVDLRKKKTTPIVRLSE